MPDETNDICGAQFIEGIIEIAPGDRFEFCVFDRCEFSGVGPVAFDNCKFLIGDAPVRLLNHGHYSCCDFIIRKN